MSEYDGQIQLYETKYLHHYQIAKDFENVYYVQGPHNIPDRSRNKSIL